MKHDFVIAPNGTRVMVVEDRPEYEDCISCGKFVEISNPRDYVYDNGFYHTVCHKKDFPEQYGGLVKSAPSGSTPKKNLSTLDDFFVGMF